MVYKMVEPKFSIIDKATVDTKTWYRVSAHSSSSKWIRQQNHFMWYEHYEKGLFDVSEELVLIMKLTWGA